MAKAKSKPETPYAAWVSGLTPETQALLARRPHGPLAAPAPPPLDEVTAAYAGFRSGLTEETQAAVDRLVPAAETPDTGGAKYMMVESRDGDLAVLRAFRTPEAMARRLGDLEGTDTVCWTFYGLALPFTRGPARYLFLPGGASAMQVPAYPGGPSKLVDGDLLDGLEIQTDGFIGLACLMETTVETQAVTIEGGGQEEQDDDGVAEPTE